MLGRPAPEAVLAVPQQNFARLFYPNPVCLLGSRLESGMANVMTISWLTCIDNEGLLFLSMNEKRTTAAATKVGSSLVLSVALTGMEELLVRVGSNHGPADGVSKPERLGIDMCQPGWTAAGGTPSTSSSSSSSLMTPATEADATLGLAVTAAGAHAVVQVENVHKASGHLCIFARVTHAWVRQGLWQSRTYRLPATVTPETPSILTFVGSRRFGAAVTSEYAGAQSRGRGAAKAQHDDESAGDAALCASTA